jgi:hypothetical protein
MTNKNPIFSFVFHALGISLPFNPRDPLVNFIHSILYFSTQTIMNKTGRIQYYIMLQTENIQIEASVEIPPSVYDFCSLIRSESTSIRRFKNQIILPETIYKLAPFAERVIDPKTLVNESAAFIFQLKPDNAKSFCLSNYPIESLNQIAQFIWNFESYSLHK